VAGELAFQAQARRASSPAGNPADREPTQEVTEMPVKITLTYTDDDVAVEFAGDCAGLWGVYRGTRMDSNAWLLAGRSAMERRYAEVHAIDGVTHGNMSIPVDDEYGAAEVRRDMETYRWVCEECPLAALAAMCAEWGAP
jgi:hypothetical protein